MLVYRQADRCRRQRGFDITSAISSMVPSPGPAASSTRAFHASQGPASLGIEQRNGSNSEVLTPFRWPEGNILPAQMACGRGASRCRRPHARGDVLSSELGRSYPCPESHAGSVHEGNGRTMGMHADEKSDGRMLPVKPRTKPSDSGGGDGGGTAAGQGEGACNACSGQRSGAFTRHLRSIFANDGVLYGCAH